VEPSAGKRRDSEVGDPGAHRRELDLFGFELDDEDIGALSTLGR
jgi:hypothetical protein